MTVMAEHETSRLFAALDELDVPAGYRAEILGDDGIMMSPSPSGLHQHNIWELDRQLSPVLPQDSRAEGHLEIRMPRLGRCVIPDLFVAPIELLATNDHQIPPDDVLLVAEVVSPGSKGNDRDRKLRIYAAAAIPLYLMIDPIRAVTTLYGDPHGSEYLQVTSVPFGKPLTVPEPFGLDLDTGRFRPY